MTRSFRLIGDTPPASPVVLSVPHAGRDYPAALRDSLRAPLSCLATLEDRLVDALALAARRDETLLVRLDMADDERIIVSQLSGATDGMKVRAQDREPQS